ncbi:unnamed protein product [Prunus armeniaca]
MACDWVLNWSRLLTVLGVGFLVGMGLRFLLNIRCPTCLERDLGEFDCLSKRGVAVHSKVSRARPAREARLVVVVIGDGWQWKATVVEQVCAGGPATTYCRTSGLKHAGQHQLSEYQGEVDGLPPTQDVERWKHNVLDFDDLLAEHEECSAQPPRRGRLKSSLQEMELWLRGRRMLSTFVGINNKKVGGMQNTQNVPLKPTADKLRSRDLLREVVCLLRGKEMLIFLSVVQVVCTSERMEIKLGGLLIRPSIRV